jgi:hypothetical protein
VDWMEDKTDVGHCAAATAHFSEVSLNLHIVAAKLSTRHQKPQPKKDDAS